MVEKVEINKITTSEVAGLGIKQKYPSVESLARKLGVPVDRTETYLRALSKTFGEGDQTERMICFLAFKKNLNKLDK